RANAVATAASTALPPLLRISTPTSEPGADTETTMPCSASTAFPAAQVWGASLPATSTASKPPMINKRNGRAQPVRRGMTTPLRRLGFQPDFGGPTAVMGMVRLEA